MNAMEPERTLQSFLVEAFLSSAAEPHDLENKSKSAGSQKHNVLPKNC